MNWRDKSRKPAVNFFRTLPIFLLLLLILLGVNGKSENSEPAKTPEATDRKINHNGELKKTPTHKEDSPDGTKQIIRYQLSHDPSLFSNYENYLNNNIFITLKDLTGNQESYIFVGEERTGDPHWLDNKYVFFTAHCGTACQGLYLVNTTSKTVKHAVISYFFEKNGPWQTHFKDWLGQEVVFPGLLEDIQSSREAGETTLTFKMRDGQRRPLKDETFVFADGRLIH